MFTWTIVRTRSFADVEWQDGTVTKDIPSVDLLPCIHLDDNEVWPSDYVTLKKEDQNTVSNDLIGLVLSVNARERTAKVRWFDQSLEHLDVCNLLNERRTRFH
jgi:hypothetical protein